MRRRRTNGYVEHRRTRIGSRSRFIHKLPGLLRPRTAGDSFRIKDGNSTPVRNGYAQRPDSPSFQESRCIATCSCRSTVPTSPRKSAPMRSNSPTPSAPASRSSMPSGTMLLRYTVKRRAFGVESASATVMSNSPAHAIITTARESHCVLIYMASHGRRSNIGMMLGSQTLKVLLNAGMPVLVAATSTPPAPSLATDLIRDEHRSLAAVLHVLLKVLDSGQDLRNPPHAELLRTIADYVETFTGTHHRPKEEEYLLPRLEARSSRYGQELAELRLQHEQGRRLADELAASVERYLAGKGSLPALREVVSRCEQSLWEHMRHVERVILPAALSHLTPEDWDEVNAAFSEGADPRFSRDSRTEFRHLFSRIVNLAPESATA